MAIANMIIISGSIMSEPIFAANQSEDCADLWIEHEGKDFKGNVYSFKNPVRVYGKENIDLLKEKKEQLIQNKTCVYFEGKLKNSEKNKYISFIEATRIWL